MTTPTVAATTGVTTTSAPGPAGTRYFTVVASPVGDLVLGGDGRSITRVGFVTDATHRTGAPAPAAGVAAPGGGVSGGGTPVTRPAMAPGVEWVEDPAPFAEAAAQLDAYFAGRLRDFDLPLAPEGTAFQRRTWGLLATIPYGRTVTYAELASAAGRPGAARAVGAANGRNPLAIVVPCHRVIGSDRTLTGYAGGLDAKRRLLTIEGALP